MEGTFEGQNCFHSDQRLEGYPSPFIRKDGFGPGNLLLRLPRLTGQDRFIVRHDRPDEPENEDVGTILRGEGCGTL